MVYRNQIARSSHPSDTADEAVACILEECGKIIDVKDCNLAQSVFDSLTEAELQLGYSL